MGRQCETDSSLLGCSDKNGIDPSSLKFEMKNTRPSEAVLATRRHVITICDYGTCPTIKSNNAINTMIVVESDGHLHSIRTRIDHSDNSHDEPLEKRTLGVLL